MQGRGHGAKVRRLPAQLLLETGLLPWVAGSTAGSHPNRAQGGGRWAWTWGELQWGGNLPWERDLQGGEDLQWGKWCPTRGGPSREVQISNKVRVSARPMVWGELGHSSQIQNSFEVRSPSSVPLVLGPVSLCKGLTMEPLGAKAENQILAGSCCIRGASHPAAQLPPPSLLPYSQRVWRWAPALPERRHLLPEPALHLPGGLQGGPVPAVTVRSWQKGLWRCLQHTGRHQHRPPRCGGPAAARLGWPLRPGGGSPAEAQHRGERKAMVALPTSSSAFLHARTCTTSFGHFPSSWKAGADSRPRNHAGQLQHRADGWAAVQGLQQSHADTAVLPSPLRTGRPEALVPQCRNPREIFFIRVRLFTLVEAGVSFFFPPS